MCTGRARKARDWTGQDGTGTEQKGKVRFLKR